MTATALYFQGDPVGLVDVTTSASALALPSLADRGALAAGILVVNRGDYDVFVRDRNSSTPEVTSATGRCVLARSLLRYKPDYNATHLHMVAVGGTSSVQVSIVTGGEG